MNDEYYNLTSELDPKEILRYLNELGITNISGEVLKYFITDLKKYIKHDLQHQNNYNNDSYPPRSEIEISNRLHSASTFSSRIRSKTGANKISCQREYKDIEKPLTTRIISSAPNIPQQKVLEQPLRRACSCATVRKKPEPPKKKDGNKITTTSSNLIKVTKQQPVKKCDPVSLYHYYTTLWEKYKPNVPGENDWSELRWSIRQKMAGNLSNQNQVPELQLRNQNRIMKG